MVHLHEISGTEEEIKALHTKCKRCRGSKTDCDTILKCSNAVCGKPVHVDCLPDDVRSEIAEHDFWYCSTECDKADEAHRNLLRGATDPITAAQVASLQSQLKQLQLENRQLTSQNKTLLNMNATAQTNDRKLQESLKRSEAEINRLRLSSTRSVPGNAFVTASDTTLNADLTFAIDASTINATNSLDASIQNLLDKTNILRTSHTQTSPLADASASATAELSAEDSQQAHAIAAIVTTLSERGKHLPELPEFSGKGAEWLCFRNLYCKLRKLGRFDDDEMMAKLRKALKGHALEYSRLWLYSARSQPDIIIENLEEKFFSPCAVITDALEVINEVPATKEKNRRSLEKLKHSIDEYINVCTDVEETIHLTGRVPESITDKLPDDLLEDWVKFIRLKTFRGDWYDFSSFVCDALKNLKVRAVDRKKQEKQITGKINAINQGEYLTHKFAGSLPPCDFDDCKDVLFRCKEFRKRTYKQKLAFIKDSGYCETCLRKGHDSSACPNKSLMPKCRVEGCKKPTEHTSIMHPSPSPTF